MQPFQTYLPQMSNGYGQQFQSPYQQRMDFLQGYQQSLQQPIQQIPQVSQQMNVLGKIVDGIEVVKAMDIPPDGNMYFFPKADGTEIYGKQWIIDKGRTHILTFKPFLDGEPNSSSQTERKTENEPFREFAEVFKQRFDSLENRINDLLVQNQAKIRTKTVQNQAKKENETE